MGRRMARCEIGSVSSVGVSGAPSVDGAAAVARILDMLQNYSTPAASGRRGEGFRWGRAKSSAHHGIRLDGFPSRFEDAV